MPLIAWAMIGRPAAAAGAQAGDARIVGADEGHLFPIRREHAQHDEHIRVDRIDHGINSLEDAQICKDIAERGLVLTGGGALLRNIDRLITTVTGVASHVAPDPLSCVAKGTGTALEHFDLFAKSITSQA